MDLKLDPYTIGGVVAISAGGYLIIKAYSNYNSVAVWNTIGMVTVGSALAWAGVRIFSAKSTGEKKKETKKIKEDVTKAIAAVGQESAEVAAAEEDLITCGNCGSESDADNFNACVYCSKQMCNQCGDYNGDCTKCGVAYCYDDSGCGDCGEVCKDCECDCNSNEAETYEAEFTQSQREKLAKKGHALTDGSFPIRNTQDLKNAVKSWGLAKKSNKAMAKKFIKLRAKQLGAMNEIPSTW